MAYDASWYDISMCAKIVVLSDMVKTDRHIHIYMYVYTYKYMYTYIDLFPKCSLY